MSITGFQDAIKNQVSHYDDTVQSLRDSNILQRSTALAGIQSEVEKYGELAKLGLEYPVAIEGTKAIVAGATKAISYFKKGKGLVGDAKSALDNIKDVVSGGKEGLAARAKSMYGGAQQNINELSERFNNLRVGSDPADMLSPGESKMNDVQELVKTKVTTDPAQGGGPDIELPATDDTNPASPSKILSVA